MITFALAVVCATSAAGEGGPAVGLHAERPEARHLAILEVGRQNSREALETLAAYLASESDPALRRAAQDAMLRMTLDEPAMLDILATSPETEARVLAANALGHHRSDTARVALLGALQDREPDVRREVYEALVTQGDRSVIPDLVKAAVREKSPSMRQIAEKAASSLAGRNPPPDDVLSALSALEGGVAADQQRAIVVLGQSRDWRAFEPLVRVAREGNLDTRRAAISALGELGDHRAVPVLLEMLGSTRGEARYRAIGSLAALGDESTAEPIAALLQDRDPQTRVLAARALGWMHLPGTARLLALALQDPSDEVRIEAVLALNRFVPTESLGILLLARADPSPFNRAEVARQLGTCGGGEATAALLGLLGDSDSLVRLTAADALADLGVAEAVEPLEKLVDHAKNEDEATAYREALERLTGKER